MCSHNNETILDRFDRYCNHTNLHGYIYLRRNNPMPVTDRVVWECIIAVNLVIGGFVLSDVWYAWIYNPYIIVFDSNVKTIWEVPFPSVTVCSSFTVKRSAIHLDNNTDEKVLLFSSFVCPNDDIFNHNLSIGESEMTSLYSFLNQVTPTCSEMLKKCFWQNKEFECCQYFRPVITDIGLCYIFNSLPSTMLFTKHVDMNFVFEDAMLRDDTVYWVPGQGYPPGRGERDTTTPFYPRWTRYIGYDKGLTLELAHVVDEAQPHCTASFSGFKVMINSPEDVPVSSKAAVRIALDLDTVLQVSPMTVTTPLDLSNTPTSLRGCLFQGERELQYFRYYTQNHCIQECLGEAFVRHCGCVPFYIPRNNSTPICSKIKDKECFRQVEGSLVSESIKLNSGRQSSSNIPWCNCYPSCNEVTYDYDLINGVRLETSPTLTEQSNITERTNFAKLTIFYKDRIFFGIHRETQGNFLDMLGTCGGLLGLLMGFSCIACVDVLYHVLIRPMGCTGLPPGPNKSPVRHLPQRHPYYIN